jgi:hypothetical protein
MLAKYPTAGKVVPRLERLCEEEAAATTRWHSASTAPLCTTKRTCARRPLKASEPTAHAASSRTCVSGLSQLRYRTDSRVEECCSEPIHVSGSKHHFCACTRAADTINTPEWELLNDSVNRWQPYARERRATTLRRYSSLWFLSKMDKAHG